MLFSMNFSIQIRFFGILALMLVSSWVLAQNIDNNTDFQNIYKQYIQTNKTGMWILGSWAGGNMIFSGIALTKAQGEAKYFHQMNVAWNVVNLGLAGFGLYDAYHPEYSGWQETINQHHKMQKILLINAGLDVGYMMTGFFLMEKSKNTQKLPERLSGFGKSLVLQGAFLLVFDVGMVIAHQKNGSQIQKVLEKVSLSANGVRVRWVF
jgi:hypothetical protein